MLIKGWRLSASWDGWGDLVFLKQDFHITQASFKVAMYLKLFLNS